MTSKRGFLPILLFVSCCLLNQLLLSDNASSTGVASPAVSSFFMPRSLLSESSRFTLATHYQAMNQQLPAGGIFQVTPFYQISTNGSQLARYFLPNNKECLTIKGAHTTGTPDMSATWLLIAGKNREPGDNEGIELYYNRFSSVVSLRPQMSRWGVQVAWFKEFLWRDREFFFSCSAPIAYARSTLRMKECQIQNSVSNYGQINDYTVVDPSQPGNPPTRLERPTLQQSLCARQALSHPLWRYAKFSDRAQNTAGIADIDCKLGIYALREQDYTVGFFGSVVVPTHYKPDTGVLFPPLIGNGHHWGLGFGATAHARMVSYDFCSAHIISELDYRYLFANHQHRSFDLCANGPLSRYLLVFDPIRETNGAQRTMLPGVNRFTQRVKVTPQSDLTWSTAFLFEVPEQDLSFSVGYNLWWKQREKIDFRPCHKNGDPSRVCVMKLFVDTENAPAQDDNPFVLQEYNKAKITDHARAEQSSNALNQAKPSVLGRGFLNTSSGAFSGIVGHTLFGSLGYRMMLCNRPCNFSLGSSYELNNDRRLLQSWSLWLECSLAL